jgi:surface carbohydrate biosynthesis protein
MEVASRELDSRLLLAVSALQRGFDIVMGQKWLIERNIEAMPPGVYFSKTLTKRDGKALARARRAGYLVAAIDEEMPGILATGSDLRWISAEAVDCCDMVFIAGTGNTHAFSQRFGAENKVVTVGNPRWDLLKPSLRGLYNDDVEAIRQQFGRFVLLNTNLGLTNTEKGTPEQIIQDQIRLGKLDPHNPGDMAYYAEIRRMEDANRAVMLDLLRKIPAGFPNLNVVLRPHPAERLDTWIDAVRGIDRVKVVRSGPAVPWIMACQALIHTNCTTGVEAYALDRPAICVLPTELTVNARYLSNKVNPTVRTADQALELLRRVLTGGSGMPYDAAMGTAFTDAMSYDARVLATETIVNRLYDAAMERRDIRSSEGWKPGRRYKWRVSQKNVRAVLMPELKAGTVLSRLNLVGGLLGCDPLATVQQCGAKLVWITSRKVPLAFYGWRTLAELRSKLHPKLLLAS